MDREQLWSYVKSLGGRDEFILHEMKRLGFWDVSQGVPKLSEELRERLKTLETELSEALTKQKKYKNRQKMLRDLRKQRMAEAKQRRVDTKENRARQRLERAERWAGQMQEDIQWLGPGVSAGLRNTESDEAQLTAMGLPVFPNLKALAEAMKIPMNELRFLAYDKKVTRTVHYKKFKIAKKTGGFREISAPGPRLKAVQHWILEQVLNKTRLHPAAHGFVPERSSVTNAAPHIGAAVVVNLDVKDFFPSVTYQRVKGVFQSLGYSEQMATVFALLCTEPQVAEMDMDGTRYFISTDQRRLPQGAPTSPAITNILCWGMDRRFEGVARSLGWNYTRYADDLTFSKKDNTNDTNRVLWQAQQILENEGFTVHPNKIKVMRNGHRKEVTGVVVNEKANVSREKLKKFRAVLHRLETKGIAEVEFGQGHVLESIQGFANYVLMVNPEKGSALKAQVNALLSKPEWKKLLEKAQQQKATTPAQPIAVPTANNGLDWWRMW